VKIKVIRLETTDFGEFGHLTTDNGYDCVTLENRACLINPGIYRVIIDNSPHLGYDTPHIIVPDRDKAAGGDAGLRIHILNFEKQSEGCIGVGLHRTLDSIEYSKAAFQGLMENLKNCNDISIEIK
jgi:hypothetical protein